MNFSSPFVVKVKKVPVTLLCLKCTRFNFLIMSFTEIQTGKIKKIGEMTPEGVEEYCKNMCNTLFKEKHDDVVQNGFKSWQDSWLEVLNDEIDRNSKDFYFYQNGVLYLTCEVKNHEEDGFFFHMERTGDDEYSFTTQYYNGGTCLEEIVEEEIEKLN